ncbi:MAG: RidA family protein [Pseudomonadota bacterium]
MSGPPGLRALVPSAIHPPFSAYSHGTVVPAGCRLVVCSGQLGIAADGAVPEGAEAQSALALANLEAILAADGLDRCAVVRLNAYVTAREHLAGYMAARNAFFAAVVPPPASTLMIVSGFARPEFLVEIECIAAGASA